MSGAVNVLGVRVDPLRLTDLVDEAVRRSRNGTRSTVLYANVHVLNTAYRDPELLAILNRADVVYCDGAGVALGARLLGQRLPGRMTGADWIEPLCAACAAAGTVLYFLGGQPGVAAEAAARLQSRHPGLRVVGTHHGYLRAESEGALLSPQGGEVGGDGSSLSLPGRGDGGEGIISAIDATRPDILLVGMGTPTQERWIAAHRDELEVPLVWAVGALFDFVAGVQPRGPRWMLDHGLEWLCRLWSDPRRLWRRYIVGNPLFIVRVMLQRIGHWSLVIGHWL